MSDRSEQLNELGAALAAAQGEFETVGKTETNPFFKSKYAGLPSVVKAATPVLTKHGLSVVQLPGHDDHGHTLTTMLLHKSGQFIAETMRLKPTKDDPQGLGSAITYGRRQAYMAALGLVADEDDDGNAASRPAPTNGASAEAPAEAAAKVQMVGPAATKQLNDQFARYEEAGLPFEQVEMQAVALGGELDTADEKAGLWHLLTRTQGLALYQWLQEQTEKAAA